MSALMEELEVVEKANNDIRAEANTRETKKQSIRDRRQKVAEQTAEAERLEAQASDLRATAAAITKAVEEDVVAFKALPELPEPADTAPLRERMAKADEINAVVDQSKRRAEFMAALKAKKAESDALTKAMEDRKAKMKAEVEAANMPLPGLGLENGMVMLDGLPLDQASDADQLRLSVAIAMRSNPKLRVIRIRDGSLLDEDSLKLMAQMADENDFQVWIEQVDSSGKIGFVIEDGMLVGSSVAKDDDTDRGEGTLI